jgi:ubiquinone/menaquinone biosynthesis C-methylase UbiE
LTGLLGDTPQRDYSHKLQLFNNFAQRELRQAIGSLALGPGMRVLDAGCGTGDSVCWFYDEVEAEGVVVGMDLAVAHTAVARAKAPAGALILQADLLKAPLQPASFDLVWCVNTINHLREPLAGLSALGRLLECLRKHRVYRRRQVFPAGEGGQNDGDGGRHPHSFRT